MLNNGFFNKLKSEKGQSLLIVVLVMVIALTVGLSIATRSITSFKNSNEQANSQKALSAAEAGVEQAIKSSASVANSNFSGGTGFTTTYTQISGTSFLFNGGNPISQDDGIDLWLTAYNSDSSLLYQNPWNGSFTIYWGDNSGPCNNAALEIVVISGSKASPTIQRYAFDPFSTRLTGPSGNGFTQAVAAQSTVAGKTFYYQTQTIPVTNGLIARIIPLYTNASAGIIGTAAFPSQGSVISSLGTSGSTARKVSVFQGYPELPSEYFLYNLFSP